MILITTFVTNYNNYIYSDYNDFNSDFFFVFVNR